jgi:hypothetical protein
LRKSGSALTKKEGLDHIGVNSPKKPCHRQLQALELGAALGHCLEALADGRRGGVPEILGLFPRRVLVLKPGHLGQTEADRAQARALGQAANYGRLEALGRFAQSVLVSSDEIRQRLIGRR